LPTIGSPLCAKKSASPPPPVRIVGRGVSGPFSATKFFSAIKPSCLWRALGTSTSSAQMPDHSITTRQQQPGYWCDQRSSWDRSDVAKAAALAKQAARVLRDAGCNRYPI
jgi:hypothetical protein